MQPGAEARTRAAAPAKASAVGSTAKRGPWRAYNWRGLVSIAAFLLLWQCASSLQWAGFKTIPGPYQVLPISTTTFLAPSGSIATGQQVNALGSQVGLPSGLFPLQTQQSAPYSAALANLLWFFAADSPAQPINFGPLMESSGPNVK